MLTYGHLQVQAVAGEDEYSSFFGDESPAGKACPADQVALNNSQQLLDNNVVRDDLDSLWDASPSSQRH